MSLAGLWDPGRFPLDDVFRTNFISMSKLIQVGNTETFTKFKGKSKVNLVKICTDHKYELFRF